MATTFRTIRKHERLAAIVATFGPDVFDAPDGSPEDLLVRDACRKLGRIAAWNDRAASDLLANAPDPDEPF